MKKRAILPLIYLAIFPVIYGCDNSKTANKENFTKILSQDFAKNANLLLNNLYYCKAISLRMPDEVASNTNFPSTIQKYEALKKAGILTSEVVKEEERPYEGKVTITKYDFSEKGKKISNQNPSLSYCQLTFKEVKSFTEPTDRSVGKSSIVNYTFVIEKVDDWVNTPEILQAYPEVKRALDSVGKPFYDRKLLVLTNEGWSTGGN